MHSARPRGPASVMSALTLHVGVLSPVLLAAPAASARPEYFDAADMPGYPGETGGLYVMPQGVFFVPFYDDSNGADTDKLLTYEAKASSLWLLDDHQSVQLNVDWRFLTPSFKTKFGTPNLTQKVGGFADWREADLAYAVSTAFGPGRLKSQAYLGGGDIGGNSAKDVQQAFHKDVIHQTYRHLTYADQPSGQIWSGGYELAYVTPPVARDSLQSQVSAGSSSNRLIDESYARLNLVWFADDALNLGLETSAFRQVDSLYSIRPWRYEAATGAMFLPYYRPSIKYVSAYLNGDPVGQWYLDFVNFCYPF